MKNKSKKAIAIGTTILVSSSTMTGHANVKNNNLNNNSMTKQEMKLRQEKVIGIKTPRTEKKVSQSYKIKQMNGKPMQVGATAYANDPITSTGTKPQVGRTIAVDPNVIPYGTKVYIPQFDKVFIAEDCGSAIKGNRIDIYMENDEICEQWGYRDITIYILE